MSGSNDPILFVRMCKVTFYWTTVLLTLLWHTHGNWHFRGCEAGVSKCYYFSKNNIVAFLQIVHKFLLLFLNEALTNAIHLIFLQLVQPDLNHSKYICVETVNVLYH